MLTRVTLMRLGTYVYYVKYFFFGFVYSAEVELSNLCKRPNNFLMFGREIIIDEVP